MTFRSAFVIFTIILCGAGLAMGQTEWVENPDNPVIEAGDPGAWAPGGIWANTVVFDGTTYHMWFTGLYENGYAADIGHATSTDGVSWVMDQSNPVLIRGESGTWDENPLIAGAVIHDGSQFHMWYTGTHEVAENIGYATSPDGSVWTKFANNPVMEVGAPGSWDDTWLLATTVIADEGTFKMWYSGSSKSVGKIGCAESTDGTAWTKWPEPVLEPGDYPGAWDENLASPSVIFDGIAFHLWYIADRPGAASGIGYAYSGDGIEWTKHRGNPVIFDENLNIWSSPVHLDDSTWKMWYSHDPGFASADYQVSHATSTCCRPLDNWRFISAAALASGAHGAFYQTDVDVSNADDQSVEYEFCWLPRGEDNTEAATSEIFTLDAGKGVRYDNVLAEIFDLEPDSLGALLLRSHSTNLLAMSRTYNLPSVKQTGTYGQAMPAINPDEFIRHGEPRRILFGTENAEIRTNVGCQNGTDTSTVVYLDLFKSDGIALGREMLILKPLGNEQVNRIFDGHNPVNGYVDVSVAQAGNLVYCYGSVLDNITSDPTTIPPQ